MSPVTITRRYLLIGKIILLSGIIFTATQCYSQAFLKEDISQIGSIDTADTTFTDLKAIKNAIGNARIVLLGEQTHGEGSTFQAKTRLIKFLHQEMGFEVLAFESGLYDCARIWENTKNGGEFSKEVIGSLFYMYATSKQMYPLFDYIQSKVNQPDPLIVAGFESQHSGVKAINDMFPDFEKFFRERNPAILDQNWELFKKLSLASFASRTYRPGGDEKKIFFNKLDTLKKVLTSNDKIADKQLTNSPGFWYQVVCSIESQTKRYWEMVSGNEVSVRDLQMAQNLIWLAEKAYPGKKIIVWAHNIHIAKNTSNLRTVTNDPMYFFSTLVPMGATISQHFGKAAYAIGFSGATGNYMDYTNSKILPVLPRSDISVEGLLSSTGFNYAFINYRPAPRWLMLPQQGTPLDYIDTKTVWPDMFDGLFFINKSFPVDR
ncbi:erythromycin esterase [Chitinophaga niastensis]|uniref:Erythromycin esterase n=1 Tax=Chitinophaga niastensis TaxID=536980 RepID=A0A2P8HM92_CHINA|nr:erythromycin esterase family protein [Chitinophaga niastensis]PSL47331.1 erythromycin esterase [Chitinophaga niastensis]